MGTELESFLSMKKYGQTAADRAKQMAYERVSVWERKEQGQFMKLMISLARAKEEAMEKKARGIRGNYTSS